MLGLQLNRTAGIYICFFLFAVYALSRRWKTPGIKLLVAASCIMAALGTIQVAVTIAMAVAIVRSVQQVLRGQISDQPDFPFQLAAIQDIVAVINVCEPRAPIVESRGSLYSARFVTDSFLVKFLETAAETGGLTQRFSFIGAILSGDVKRKSSYCPARSSYPLPVSRLFI